MDNSARMVRTVGRIMRTHYPRFLFGMPVKRGDVPVFTYHEADPVGLAQDLAYLAENGYRTLGLEEYISQGPGSSDTSRRVLLTFDDARRSFWEVGRPTVKAVQGAGYIVRSHVLGKQSAPATGLGA